MTGLESWEGFEDLGNQWLEVRHSVGRSENEEYSERQRADVLLELDTGPAAAGDRSGGVAFEQRGET